MNNESDDAGSQPVIRELPRKVAGSVDRAGPAFHPILTAGLRHGRASTPVGPSPREMAELEHKAAALSGLHRSRGCLAMI